MTWLEGHLDEFYDDELYDDDGLGEDGWEDTSDLGVVPAKGYCLYCGNALDVFEREFDRRVCDACADRMEDRG